MYLQKEHLMKDLYPKCTEESREVRRGASERPEAV